MSKYEIRIIVEVLDPVDPSAIVLAKHEAENQVVDSLIKYMQSVKTAHSIATKIE